MSAVRRYISDITEFISSPSSVRSLQSRRRTMNIPLAAPCPLIMALPVTLENIRICGISLIRRSISFITSFVSSRLLPGEVRTSMNTVPISSWGTRPVLVVFIKKNNPAPATISNTPVSHLRLTIKNTPPLYFITTRWKAVSKAM